MPSRAPRGSVATVRPGARTGQWRRALLAILLALAAVRAAAAPTPTPAAAGRAALTATGRVSSFTLLDPSLALPPLAAMAPDLSAVAETLGDEPAAPTIAADPTVGWKLDYRHAELSDMLPTDSLRADPSTGFSRQLDRDVLALGMSWRMAGSRVGLGYQLQAGRDGDLGLSRFLPSSEAATHAVTLGVSREFGAGAPAPPPLPPFALGQLADATPTGESTPPPSPSP